MCNQTKTAVLTCLMALLLPSITEAAQLCKAASIRATSPTNQYTDHKNGTVTSSKTGLMWKKCSEGQTWNAANGRCSGTPAKYSWQTALNRATAVNSKGGFAGKTDWRLPNIKDLASIVEEQCINPAINLAVFPTTPSGWFWSSSPGDNVGAANAWYLDFSNGNDNWDYKILFEGRVRLVRSGL
jgi:hypothetical protein